MASHSQTDDGGQTAETSDNTVLGDMSEVMVELTNSVGSSNTGHTGVKNTPRSRAEKMKQSHLIMINQSGGPTVVSSGGSGHVQHVSVVGHVQQVPGGYDGGSVLSGSDSDELPSKRKATSFKITNVYLSRPPSNDGDESCDDNEDLEDSHTEDLSEIADSLSSQLETVAALNNAAALAGGGQVQVQGGRGKAGINSSSEEQEFPFKRQGFRRLSTDKDWETNYSSYSHPGFGFVTYHQTGNSFHPVSYLDKTVSGAVAVFNSMECDEVLSEGSQPVVGPQDFKTKFKVVKVETTEPLKRGRWTCIDFTDKQTAAPAATTAGESKPTAAAAAVVTGSSNNGTVPQSKPSTKTETVLTSLSRPGSTLPRDTSTEPSSVITSDNQTSATSDQQPAPVKSDSEHVDNVVAPVQEQEVKEVEAVMKVETRAPSESRTIPTSFPSGAAYPTPASSSNNSNSNGLNISLPQQSVITPTPGSVPSVQSPHTGGSLPDYNILQNTIGQVIRLNDGTLAQVALAPLTQQQQVVQRLPQQQQQQVPNSSNQQQIVHPPQQQQQQVMVAAQQGQQYLVSQQQTLNQVPQPQQQQSSRSQMPSQQQPPAVAVAQPSQQQNNRSQQQQPLPSQHQVQPPQQQQPPIRNQQQNSVQPQQATVAVQQQQQPPPQQQQQSLPSNHGVITNAATIPMQQQPQQPSNVVPQQQQPQHPQQQQMNSFQQHPQQQQQVKSSSSQQQQQQTVVPQQQQQQQSTSSAVVTQPVSAPVKRQSTSSVSGSAPQQQQQQAPASGQQQQQQSRAASVSSQQQQQQSVSQNGVVTVNTLNHPSVLSSVAPSHSNYFNSVYGAGQSAMLSAAASGLLGGYSAVIGGIDSEGLVERLEDLVSTQFGEDSREVDLSDLESASGAGQGSIDHRIEQAMDLVKSHLMTAVRSEVEELRDKIAKLEDTVGHLSRENEVLRANVNPEVLASLIGNRSILGGSMPPDPNNHPALQPPNQH